MALISGKVECTGDMKPYACWHYPAALDTGRGHPFPGRTSPFPSILEILPPIAVPTQAQLPASAKPCYVGHLSHSLSCLVGTHSNPQGRARWSQRKGDIPRSCPLPTLSSKTLWAGKGSSSTQTNCSLSQQSDLCSKKITALCALRDTPQAGDDLRAINRALGRCSSCWQGPRHWTLGKTGQLCSEY